MEIYIVRRRGGGVGNAQGRPQNYSWARQPKLTFKGPQRGSSKVGVGVGPTIRRLSTPTQLPDLSGCREFHTPSELLYHIYAWHMPAPNSKRPVISAIIPTIDLRHALYPILRTDLQLLFVHRWSNPGHCPARGPSWQETVSQREYYPRLLS